jgi:hypothetical protein
MAHQFVWKKLFNHEGHEVNEGNKETVSEILNLFSNDEGLLNNAKVAKKALRNAKILRGFTELHRNIKKNMSSRAWPRDLLQSSSKFTTYGNSVVI